MNGSEIFARIVQTLRDPRAGAQWVLSHDLPLRACWLILLLVAIGGTAVAVLAELLGVAVPAMIHDGQGSSFTFWLGFINLALLTFGAWLTYALGRAAGGTGDLGGAVLLAAWFQTILIALQLLQYAALLIVPALAALIGLIGLVLMGWLPTNFIAVLHGFRSRIAVFLGLVVTSFVLLMLVSILLRAMGLNLTMGMPA